MVKPKISVVLLTKRTGGIDVARYSLVTQRFPKKDFEFILVDELHEKRAALVKEYFKGTGVKLVQVNASKERHPKWKPWEYTFGRSNNLGLLYAEGELLVFCGDYMLLCPTFLEAMWTAWEKWGRKGICVPISPHRETYHQYKPSLKEYCGKWRQIWDKRGGSSNLDAPPDTWISTYTKDFSEDPRVHGDIGHDQRFVTTKHCWYEEMRDPSPSDPPLLKEYHVGPAGRFNYWRMKAGDAFGCVVPVEDAVAVNGSDDSFNGYWGGWGEINIRMEKAFDHRYVYTLGCVYLSLPHRLWGWDNPRHLGKTNIATGGFKRAKQLAYDDGVTWADNPFNMAEERRRLRETGETDLALRT